MDNSIWIAFVTGLTTGGLSCLAVQGGLLTSSLANRLEAGLQARAGQSTAQAAAKGKKDLPPKGGYSIAEPIGLFLLAKLAAYTLLGFLLGWLGTVLSLTPLARGILQLAIGIFMLGNGLRMLKVHPIFRYFNFEPPAAVTRFIRKRSKGDSGALTPLMMGALTVLIPCGVTQAMMALAIGTGSPVMGAALMFAFILGTSPVFFAVTYLATRLSAMVEKWFMKIVAVSLIVLSLITVNAGLNLVGLPLGLFQDASAAAPVTDLAAPTQAVNSSLGGGLGSGPQTVADTVEVQVTNQGYFPQHVAVPAGKTVHVKLVTNHTTSCSVAFVIPTLNVQVVLPETGSQTIDLPAQPAGTQMAFSCSMGMFTGAFFFQ